MSIADILTRLATKIPKVYEAGKTDFGYKKSVSGTNHLYIDDININEKNIDVVLTSDTVTDFSSVTVRVCGKNLIPFPYITTNYNANGITAVQQDDGGILVNGTTTADVYLNIAHGVLYYASIAPWGLNGCSISLWHNDLVYVAYDNKTKTIFIKIPKGQTFTNEILYPQIVLGSELGVYEKGVAQKTYKPTADGVLQIDTVYPNTSIISLESNVTINTEYYADTEKVVQNLTDTIISLGGTV